jgi:hypothetical protein
MQKNPGFLINFKAFLANQQGANFLGITGPYKSAETGPG